MRRIVFLTLGLLLAVSGYTQKTADIGIFGGVSNYQGDLERYPFTQFSLPSFGAFFRYNLHYRTSVRAMFLMGNVSGAGIIQNNDFSFGKNVKEFTLQAEINYLRYMIGNSKASFTSYVTGGIGLMQYPYVYGQDVIDLLTAINPMHNKGNEIIRQSVFTAALPFGLGFKFNVGPRAGFGIEYQMRKLLNDRLDNLDDPLAYVKGDNLLTYRDIWHNNDWVGFLGLHFTYKVYLGRKPCPAYDVKY